VIYSVDILFGVVLLLLVVAIVILFAMLGELASRIPASAEPDRTVRPIDTADIGAVAEEWPTSLEDIPAQSSQATAMLAVLSTSCSTCQIVAEQIAKEQRRTGRPRPGFAVIVSCPVDRVGEDFIERHGLGTVPHYVDAGGRWVSNSFRVTISPSVLLLRNGVLTSALMFHDFTAMQDAVSERSTSKEERWPTNPVPARESSPDGESSLSSAQVP
jgi:hypothetical protein